MSRPCPVCQYDNPEDARFCFNPECRQPLDAPPTSTPVAATTASEGVPTWVKAVVPLGVLALAGVLFALLTGNHRTTRAAAVPTTTVVVSTTAAATTTVAAATTTTADPSGVPIGVDKIASAVASSTLPDQDGLSYGIERTLDQRDNTAWNSAGSTGGADPIGQTLTYTFTSPQNIRKVRIINGFSRPTPDRTFTDNYRVRGLVVHGGGKEVTFSFELQDTTVAQSMPVDFGGPVDSVTLEITSVFDTTKWKDVAVTEVQFFATP